MKLPISGNAKDYAVLLGAAAGVAILLYMFGKKQVKDAAAAVANVNQGTPYEGTGVVGTVGHATDAASGGLLSGLGGWLGRSIYDLTHDEYDPNAPVTTSRKQAVQDNFYYTPPIFN